MNTLSDKEKIALKQLTDVVRWHAPREKYSLYLFGSRATGRGKPNSDYDIAIEWENELPWSARMSILSAWEWLPYRADLIDLHEVDARFSEAIKKEAIPL